MTWNLKRIPKIAHYFWDNRPLSFLRWASINSFSVLNPDWELKLHVSSDSANPNWSWPNNKQKPSGDYRGWLDRIKNLKIIEEVQFPGLHGVFQSDILRNQYLVEDGGLWSDVDILYYKPITEMVCNQEEFADMDCALCVPTAQWFPIAFMAAAPGCAFFKTVHTHQLAIYKASKGRGNYQKFGSKVYRNALSIGDYSYIDLAAAEVYQTPWTRHGSIFEGEIDLEKGVGTHWYGGSPSSAKFEPLITHENWRK